MDVRKAGLKIKQKSATYKKYEPRISELRKI
jgi:hypothetical protein